MFLIDRAFTKQSDKVINQNSTNYFSPHKSIFIAPRYFLRPIVGAIVLMNALITMDTL